MKVTYLELLEMIRDGNQPNKVEYNSVIYTYDGTMYRNSTVEPKFLSDAIIEDYEDIFLANEKCIEIVEEHKPIE